MAEARATSLPCGALGNPFWSMKAACRIRYVMVGTSGSAPFDFMMRPATNHKALKFAGWT